MITLLERFIKERNIRGVAFDLDSTLLDTTPYFRSAVLKGATLVAENLNEIDFVEEEVKKIIGLLKEVFADRNRKPILIIDLLTSVVEKYSSEEDAARLRPLLEEEYRDFYLKSPKSFPDTKDVLLLLHSLDIPFVIHSHAQEDWTRIKVKQLEKETGLELLWHYTDITGEKNSESWQKAISLLNLDIKDVLVIGDNLHADIIPPFQIGCRNLIWINSRDEELPSNMSGLVTVIEELSELVI